MKQWYMLPNSLVGNEAPEQRCLLGVALPKRLWGQKDCVKVRVATLALVSYPVGRSMGIHLWLEVCKFSGASLILDVDAE